MKNLVLIIIAALMLSCTKEEIATNNEVNDIPVVQSYLEPNTPIQVMLTKMLPFVEGGNDGVLSIDSAQVFISHNGISYLLSPIADNNGKYECLDTNLQIIPNETYNLSFDYNGNTVSATTTIPIKPQDAVLSATTHYVDPNITGPGSSNQNPLTVYWSNADNSYYVIVIEYLESSYNPINENLDPDLYDQFRKISTSPLNESSTNLNTRQHLLFFGSYRIIVYKVNEEYVNLYENISQNTLNMTEPLTNIENGLGIFSGINSDTLMLEVRSL